MEAMTWLTPTTKEILSFLDSLPPGGNYEEFPNQDQPGVSSSNTQTKNLENHSSRESYDIPKEPLDEDKLVRESSSDLQRARLTARNLSFFEDCSPNRQSAPSISTMSSQAAAKNAPHNGLERMRELKRQSIVAAEYPMGRETIIQEIENRLSLNQQEAITELVTPARFFLPHGKGASIEYARNVALAAPNISIITREVVPSLVPIGSLLLSKHYDAITDSQWCSAPLSSEDNTAGSLCIPQPDLAIGYKASDLLHSSAIEYLGSFSTPVTCRSQLAFPCFCLEAKAFDSIQPSVLQNHINAAHMLRALYTLRSKADQPGWQTSFEGHITVITVSISKEKICIHGHWVTSKKGQLEYHSQVLKAWPTEYNDWSQIYHFINNAIFTILEQNRAWIVADLYKIRQMLEEEEQMQLAPGSVSLQNPKKRKLTT